MIQTVEGFERYAGDTAREINLDTYYTPYPMQRAFHASPVPHRLLGGAAGPGKTLALIMDHLVACNEFSDPAEAKQVHTLILRRTHPKLEETVITRFREKVPRELYADFNETKKIVTWLNGATTRFSSMQHERDAMEHQGQWFKIGYDEMAEFTFKQWMGMAAWNRCPVSPYCTQDGATNPVGVGAGWIKSLFVDHKPCAEMDDHQRSQYRASDYEYFPCTYLDNPIYANDPAYIAKLESYPKALRDALKLGIWGGVGTYFDIWDPAKHVYRADSLNPQPWWPKWLSGDWGFEHWAAFHWHTTSPQGKHYTYREMVVKHQGPRQLAESIARLSVDANGQPERIDEFHFSFDAFAQRTDADPIANQVWDVLKDYKAGTRPQFAIPSASTRDVRGSGMLLYELLNHSEWQIADTCQYLIECIPMAPRDLDGDPEAIAEFEGNDPLDSARYGLYGRLNPKQPPLDVRVQDRLADMAKVAGAPLVGTDLHLAALKLRREESMKGRPVGPRRFRPGAWKN